MNVQQDTQDQTKREGQRPSPRAEVIDEVRSIAGELSWLELALDGEDEEAAA